MDEDLVASLAPGATDKDLGELERDVGRALPTEFKQAWKTHNGHSKTPLATNGYSNAKLFAMLEILDTREIAAEWQQSQEFCAEEMEADTEGPVKSDWWNSAWIPIALIGGETRYFCIDLDPAKGGRPGQIIEASPKNPERRVVAPSLRAFLDKMANAVAAGASVVDGEIDISDELGI